MMNEMNYAAMEIADEEMAEVAGGMFGRGKKVDVITKNPKTGALETLHVSVREAKRLHKQAEKKSGIKMDRAHMIANRTGKVEPKGILDNHFKCSNKKDVDGFIVCDHALSTNTGTVEKINAFNARNK